MSGRSRRKRRPTTAHDGTPRAAVSKGMADAALPTLRRSSRASKKTKTTSNEENGKNVDEGV